jgi:hypothetical protein
MNTQERMNYILNNRKIIQHHMYLHDQEVKNKKPHKTLFEKFKEVIKGK